MRKTISCLALLLAIAAQAQTITYEQYNKAVAENNAGYLAEKYNIEMATARLQAAHVFNDPELSVEYGNNQDWSVMMGQSVEVGLSYDLDLAGARSARIQAARSESDMTQASVAAYFSNLKLEAAQAWSDAWKLSRSCEVLEEAVNNMTQIARSDSIRLSLGDIGEADATQSRIEALKMKGELISLKAEFRNALMNLSYLCGGESITGLADGDLPELPLSYSESELRSLSESNRAELKTAELAQTLSEDNLRIVQASRAFDMGLNLGYSYNTEVRNEIAPAPVFRGLTVGVTVPLKFSSMNRGEMAAARAQILQSQKAYESARIQVMTETSQAYNSYIAAKDVFNQYGSSIMDDARKVLESRKLGYLKGESSLVELLAAQQTYRDVMQGYIDACSNYFLAQSMLSHAVGL